MLVSCSEMRLNINAMTLYWPRISYWKQNYQRYKVAHSYLSVLTHHHIIFVINHANATTKQYGEAEEREKNRLHTPIVELEESVAIASPTISSFQKRKPQKTYLGGTSLSVVRVYSSPLLYPLVFSSSRFSYLITASLISYNRFSYLFLTASLLLSYIRFSSLV